MKKRALDIIGVSILTLIFGLIVFNICVYGITSTAAFEF